MTCPPSVLSHFLEAFMLVASLHLDANLSIILLGAATILQSYIVQSYFTPPQLLSTLQLSRPSIVHPPLNSTPTIVHNYNCPGL